MSNTSAGVETQYATISIKAGEKNNMNYNLFEIHLMEKETQKAHGSYQ